MRVQIFALVAMCVTASAWGQSAPAGRTAQPASESLPVRRVILYKTGVGYFEHRGRITDSQYVTIRFTSSQLNDVLKSLTAIDLGSGRVTGIGYNSSAQLDRRLNGLQLPVGRNATLVDLLQALRGARVEITEGRNVAGRLLSVERRIRHAESSAATEVDVVTIVTDVGELRTYDVGPSLRIRVTEGDLQQEIGRYLDLVGTAREQDVRRMVIRTAGSGERDLFISYVSEVPVWKTTYRMVLPDRGAPFLQGWAIVDNTIGEDWTGVSLSLVAGAPQTFIQEISQPYYTRRPVVPLPQSALLAPQTHTATLEAGAATLAGRVRDTTGGGLPAVQVSLADGSRRGTATTDTRGEYRVTVPAGVYDVDFQLPGFSRVSARGVSLSGGITRQHDVEMRVGALEETVTTAANRPVQRGGGTGGGIAGGIVAGVTGGSVGGLEVPPQAPVGDALRAMQPAAAAADLGDLFEYRITEPVTIPQNESALVPILSAEVAAEKVSLWTRTSGAGRPLRAVWLTNTSKLTLDGGSFSVVEGEAFAGEGLMEPLQPGERRLLSYASDLGVLVNATSGKPGHRIVRIRARNGIVIEDSEERSTALYAIRNEEDTPRVVVVEHPVRSGWQLVGGPEPAERSPGAYRFRVPVEARSEVVLEVAEKRVAESSIAFADIDHVHLAMWASSGVPTADAERALKPIFDKRLELASIFEQISRLETERERIFADQQRLRENLKAIGGSVPERLLVERYTRQLDQQESRLEATQGELAQALSERDRAQKELAQLIGEVTFEALTPTATGNP